MSIATSQEVTLRVSDETGTAAEKKIIVAAGTSDSDAVRSSGIPAGGQVAVVGRVDLVDEEAARERAEAEEAARHGQIEQLAEAKKAEQARQRARQRQLADDQYWAMKQTDQAAAREAAHAAALRENEARQIEAQARAIEQACASAAAACNADVL